MRDLRLARVKDKFDPAPTREPFLPKVTKAPLVKSPSPIQPSTSDILVGRPPIPIETALPVTPTPAPAQKTLSTLANRLFGHPSRYLRQFFSLIYELSHDDSFLRTFLFALALTMALLRRDVRYRVRVAITWIARKVRETM